MFKNDDDIGMRIVSAELFNDSDFIGNGSINFPFASGWYPNQFPCEFLLNG